MGGRWRIEDGVKLICWPNRHFNIPKKITITTSGSDFAWRLHMFKCQPHYGINVVNDSCGVLVTKKEQLFHNAAVFFAALLFAGCFFSFLL